MPGGLLGTLYGNQNSNGGGSLITFAPEDITFDPGAKMTKDIPENPTKTEADRSARRANRAERRAMYARVICKNVAREANAVVDEFGSRAAAYAAITRAEDRAGNIQMNAYRAKAQHLLNRSQNQIAIDVWSSEQDRANDDLG